MTSSGKDTLCANTISAKKGTSPSAYYALPTKKINGPTFPNNRRLSNFSQRLMRHHDEVVEQRLEVLSRLINCRLERRVLHVAVRVHLVAAGGEERRGKGFSDVLKK